MKTTAKLASICLFSLLVIGLAATVLVQHRSLYHTQRENHQLRQVLDAQKVEMEHLAAEKEQLKKSLIAQQAAGEPTLDGQQFNELIRLRGEVGRARLLEREATQLQHDRMQVAQAKLSEAREKLPQIRKLHSERIVSDTELDQAEFEVKLLAAQAKGDEAGVYQIRLEQAERELARATELYNPEPNKSLVSQAQYEKAVHKVELARSGRGE